MARKPSNLSISVKDLGILDQKRSIEVRIVGEAGMFQTSDFCAREGVISSLEKVIEGKIKEGISLFSKSGPEFLRSAKLSRQSTEKSIN